MAKLSEQKKVELLEAAVKENDVVTVRSLYAEHGSFEFTARALCMACRIASTEIVKELCENGASFKYEYSPALAKKYDCKIATSNRDSYPKDYNRFIVVGRASKLDPDEPQIAGDIRRANLKVVWNYKDAVGLDAQEVLFHALLWQDDDLVQCLKELGVSTLSPYRADMAAGRLPHNRLDSFGRYDRGFFSNAFNREPELLADFINGFALVLGNEPIHIFKNDIMEYDFQKNKDVLKTKLCSESVFMTLIKYTDFSTVIKKREILYALIEENNAAGFAWALEQGWVDDKEKKALLKFAQTQENVSASLMALLLDQNKTEEPPADALSLSLTPSAADLKKIWGTKKMEDGTLMITSYKGEDTYVVVPSMIGKNTVSAISPDTFNPDAPRITEVQRNVRQSIVSVEFPGSIHEIPSRLFCGGYGSNNKSLKYVVLHEGILKICDSAFQRCAGIEELIIPDSVMEIGAYAFSGCRSLKKIKLPDTLTSLSAGLFSGTGFENFEISKNIKSIDAGVFRECENLKEVICSASITAIPESAFAWCKDLHTIKLPSGITAIGRLSFAGCAFEEFSVPETVTSVGSSAFERCENLKRIQIPPSTILGDEVFSGCNGLANENGAIVVGGVLYGVAAPVGSYGLPAAEALKPLVIGSDVSTVAASRNNLPEIVYKEHSEPGLPLDVSQLSVGDEVCFGRFPEKEDYLMAPLKWKVLAIEGDCALMITLSSIISLRNELRQTGIWKDAPARVLLNDAFFDSAFTDIEKRQIIMAVNANPKNKAQHVDGGPDTEDRVFLLSIDEVEKYMNSEESRTADATEYAHKQHPTKRDVGFWQLRTPGKDGWGSVAVSSSFGDYCAMTGNHVGYSYLRPAIWIKQV